MPCAGISDDHCCWVEGAPCPHLRDDGSEADRRWVCTLREELGDWDAVHVDPRYGEHPRPVWVRLGLADCGDWTPTVDAPCGACGWDGS